MQYTLKNSTVTLNEEYDVIVCGGGPAGCAAAIGAAREGAKTLLIETTGVLGGMSTMGLVNQFPHMYDPNNVTHGGIAEKIAQKLRPMFPFAKPGNSGWLPIDFETIKELYDDMVQASGADILLYSHVTAVEMKDERNIDVILVANKAGLTAYRAKVFVDTTGDADLYAWAGQPFEFGNEEHKLQAGSMCFVMTNVSEEGMVQIRERYADGQPMPHRAMIRKILADGKYDIPDDHYVAKKFGKNLYSFNAGHVYGLDATDPKSLTKATLKGRKLANDMVCAFKEYGPEAYENARLVMTAPSMGIRESRRIHGDYWFTVEDYLNRQTFHDEVFHGKYYIDVHEDTPGVESPTDLQYEHYGEFESYGVPYRCLCPKGLDNVLVAGRTICSERIANGTLRVMSCCLNSGEAAGLAAALAAQGEAVNIHQVDTQTLRRRLIEEGAALPKLETDTF